MQDPKSFDIESFQTEVQKRVAILQHPPLITRQGSMSNEDLEALRRILRLYLDDEQADMELERFKASGQLSPSVLKMITSKMDEISQADDTAREVVERGGFRQYICAALRSVSDDAFEIAKVITPVLVPLALTGTIPIPPDPMIVAAIAVAVARVGTSTFCGDYAKQA
jgi:hypothetical protein